MSLVLTKYKVRQAEVTLSPFLKETVPTASLGTEVISQPAYPKSQKQNDEFASMGCKLQSLCSAADTILKSATKLENEMKLEAKYWKQVLSVSEKGWCISRVPKEKQTLGVRFGFLESPAEFRDKGLAPLRRGENGSVELDLSINRVRPKILRARVLHNGKFLASSLGHGDKMDDDSLESDLLRARDSIFDSELFAEIYREGRNSANRDVRCLDNGILIPLEDTTSVLVELVDRSSKVDVLLPEHTHTTLEKTPALILVILRILLSHSHRQTYRRRMEKPLAISERRAQWAPPSILRPVLSYLQHRAAISTLEHALEQIRRVFVNAKLEFEVASPTDQIDWEKIFHLEAVDSSEYVYEVVEALSGHLQVSITIKAPSQGTELTIQSRTHALGTQYKLIRSAASSLDPKVDLMLSEDTIYTDQSDLLSTLVEALQADLVKSIDSQSRGIWHAETPLWGELETSPKDGYYHQVRINLQRDRLELAWAVVRFVEEISSRTVKVWKSTSNPEEKRVGLVRAMELLSSAPLESDPEAYSEQMFRSQ